MFFNSSTVSFFLGFLEIVAVNCTWTLIFGHMSVHYCFKRLGTLKIRKNEPHIHLRVQNEHFYFKALMFWNNKLSLSKQTFVKSARPKLFYIWLLRSKSGCSWISVVHKIYTIERNLITFQLIFKWSYINEYLTHSQYVFDFLQLTLVFSSCVLLHNLLEFSLDKDQGFTARGTLVYKTFLCGAPK